MKNKLVEHIHKRIIYINNKLECCLGYAPSYKACRIEELRELLKWLEEYEEEN